MSMIIAGEECEQCLHSEIKDDDKSRIMVYCKARDKWYYWGQYVPCENQELRK